MSVTTRVERTGRRKTATKVVFQLGQNRKDPAFDHQKALMSASFALQLLRAMLNEWTVTLATGRTNELVRELEREEVKSEMSVDWGRKREFCEESRWRRLSTSVVGVSATF